MSTTIELGMQVKDRITEFTGTVVGIINYISGCNQALIVPKVKKDGTITPGEWFDVQRLEVVSTKRIVLNNDKTPGFDQLPTRRI